MTLNQLQKLRDPRWRLNNLYYIKTKQGKKVKFKENPIQKIINDCNDTKYIILKARQFGVSTNELLKKFDKVIWTPNLTCCILAHEQDSLKKLFEIVHYAYENMDERVKPEVGKGGGSRYELKFPRINSKIYVDLESRSETIQLLHISEAAFIKDKSRIDATLQAVPIGGTITYETTPNGMNFFYDMWVDQSYPATKMFFPWFMFSEYALDVNATDYTDEEKLFIKTAKERFNIDITPNQIAYRRNKQYELKEIFYQEYPENDTSCFLTSGNPFFDIIIVKDRLQSLSNRSSNEQKPITNQSLSTTIYKQLDRSKNYVCGVDTSEGCGNDYCVASIFCVETGEQVAVLRGHFKPSDFAHRINNLCQSYKNKFGQVPLLGVERNNHGHAVLLELKEHIDYENLYVHTDSKPGWLTNSVTKPIMLNGLKDYIESNPNNFFDINTLNEMLTYVNNNGKINAIDGKHDDAVIASAIAVQMLIKESRRSDWDSLTKIQTEGGAVESII